jgi:nucleoside-triphosphatase
MKIFLSGPPGCGKTTIVKGVAGRFPERVTGFYTEEIRDERGQRTGFDLVSHAGKRRAFARKGGVCGTRVGKYSVFLEPLEVWGLELLKPSSERPLVILDEVGKMECLSRPFRERVLELVDSRFPILGSVALRGAGLIRILHERPDIECREISPASRAGLIDRLAREYRQWLAAHGFTGKGEGEGSCLYESGSPAFGSSQRPNSS